MRYLGTVKQESGRLVVPDGTRDGQAACLVTRSPIRTLKLELE